MVNAANIGWGSYGGYEGPWYKGKCPYVLPDAPDEPHRVMAVITATEGGRFDAFNGYDSCGWTTGIIQWIEKGQYSVSDLLGAVSRVDSGLILSVTRQANSLGFDFRQDSRGRHRFHIGMDPVDTEAEQRRLFYGTGTGKKGTWDAGSKLYARQWAAAISTVWEDPRAQEIQTKFTADRLPSFMQQYAKSVFDGMPSTDLAKAVRAAYLSFAANNPTWANKALKKAADSSTKTPWTLDWAVEVIRSLTFSPQVAIYPHRYDCIRPVLEKLYGLSLPDFADDLRKWSASTGIPVGLDTRTLQRALISLGYDLGPAADDGVYGEKTRSAVLVLEQLSGMVPAEAQDGMVDVHTFPALCAALEAKGLPLMSQ